MRYDTVVLTSKVAENGRQRLFVFFLGQLRIQDHVAELLEGQVPLFDGAFRELAQRQFVEALLLRRHGLFHVARIEKKAYELL